MVAGLTPASSPPDWSLEGTRECRKEPYLQGNLDGGCHPTRDGRVRGFRPLSGAPCWTLLRLHSSHLGPSGFGLHLLPEGRDMCMGAFPEPRTNANDSPTEASMSAALSSISAASFPCPFCHGGHEAVPRDALFLLLTWAPQRAPPSDDPGLSLAGTFCSSPGIFLPWQPDPTLEIS